MTWIRTRLTLWAVEFLAIELWQSSTRMKVFYWAKMGIIAFLLICMVQGVADVRAFQDVKQFYTRQEAEQTRKIQSAVHAEIANRVESNEEALRATITDLSDKLDQIIEKQHQMELRVTLVETTVSRFTSAIDHMASGVWSQFLVVASGAILYGLNIMVRREKRKHNRDEDRRYYEDGLRSHDGSPVSVERGARRERGREEGGMDGDI